MLNFIVSTETFIFSDLSHWLMTHDSLCIESFDSLILYTHQTEQNCITCIVSVPIRKMSIFLPFQDLTHQCIMASSSHKRRIWSQVTYFLYSDFQVGRTERLDNTLNPRFSKAVLVDYFFEELQKLKFFIYDIDSPTGNLKTADFLGELECTLGQVRYMLNLLAYYTDILLAHQGFFLCVTNPLECLCEKL